MHKTLEQEKNYPSNFTNAVINGSVLAIAKAAFIDLPVDIAMLLARGTAVNFASPASNSIAYGMRTAGRIFEHQYIAACAAGASKSIIQDFDKLQGLGLPAVGCVKTVLYEICKDVEQCKNNEAIGIILIETIGGVAQYLTGATIARALLGGGVAGLMASLSTYVFLTYVEPRIINALSYVSNEKLIETLNVTPSELVIDDFKNATLTDNEDPQFMLVDVENVANSNDTMLIETVKPETFCDANYTEENDTVVIGCVQS